MKLDERKQACELRTLGFSLKEISKQLNVAKSSVSVWVRDIKLDDHAMKRIELNREKSYKNRNVNHYSSFTNKRIQWREDALNLINNRDSIDVALLYWAEGYKKNNKNTVAFTNSDPSMIFIFMNKLIAGYNVSKSDIKISLNIYTDLHTQDDIKLYWMHKLDISDSCISVGSINNISSYSNKKRCGLLEWGTCRLMVHSTKVLQQIYGVIDLYTELNGMKSDCTGIN